MSLTELTSYLKKTWEEIIQLDESINNLSNLIGGQNNTAPSLNDLLKDLNENRIGDISTENTLNWLVDQLNAKIKELNEQRIGDINTENTLNYLVNLLNSKLDTTNKKLGDVSTDDTVIFELNETVSKLTDTISRLDTLNNKIGDVSTSNTVLERLQKLIDQMGDESTSGTLIFGIKDLRDKIGDTATAGTTNYLLDQLNAKIGDVSSENTLIERVNALVNKIGDTTTENTVLERLQKVINQIGDTTTADTLIYLLKDLNEQRIGSVDAENTLNWLMKNLIRVLRLGLVTKLIRGTELQNIESEREKFLDIYHSYRAEVVYDSQADTYYLKVYMRDYSGTEPSTTEAYSEALDAPASGYSYLAGIVGVDRSKNKLIVPLLYYSSDELRVTVYEFSIASDYSVSKAATYSDAITLTGYDFSEPDANTASNNDVSYIFVKVVSGGVVIFKVYKFSGGSATFIKDVQASGVATPIVDCDDGYIYNLIENDLHGYTFEDFQYIGVIENMEQLWPEGFNPADSITIYGDKLGFFCKRATDPYDYVLFPYSKVTATPTWQARSTKTTDDIVSAIQGELTRLAKLKAYDSSASAWKDVPIESFLNLKDNLDYKISSLSSDIKSELTRLAKLKAYNSGAGTWDDVPIEAFNNLKNYLNYSLSDLSNDIKSKLPRLLYGYDGTDWVPLKVTSDGKLLCTLG